VNPTQTTIDTADSLEVEEILSQQDESADTVEATGINESLIDPRLLAMAENVTNIIGNTEGVELLEETAEAVFDEMENPIKTKEFVLLGREFITFLSQINVIRNETFSKIVEKHRVILDRYRGNSRAKPTFFRHYCRKTKGCEYFTFSHWGLRLHETKCSATMVETQLADRPFECLVDGCSSRFATKDALKNHDAQLHTWKPRGCKNETCDPNIIYNSLRELRKHRMATHSP